MDRLENLIRRYENDDMVRVEWMDHLVFREIESLSKATDNSYRQLFLYIELPKFEFPVVFSDKDSSLSLPLQYSITSSLNLVHDLECTKDNPVESKHRKLARSHRNGPLDRDLKPNAKIRDELNKILKYPPTCSLTTEEKDLLWKFRFYLTRDKKALTKFLKCVVWEDPVEVKQSVDLLIGWVDIDVEDALELLGQGFENRSVRSYAVTQLEKADDDLVQALKFEGISSDKSDILESPLVEFLVDRSVKNRVLGNYFYWYLMVECEDKVMGKMYAKIAYQFMSYMVEVPEGFHRRDLLRRQAELIASLAKISKDIRSMKDNRQKKIERLRATIADPKNGLMSFPPIPLPLDANIQVTGIIADKASVFKSALMPLRLTFSCLDGSEYPVIFKTGDDLRQDQLVVQIITLMDRLLRKENLDLRLTPYKVLATGADHDFGFILGRDPKPFPPPMKLSKEMVDVMGGTSSPHFQRFKSFCFIAFNSLRKSANLILNLFSLMVSANVPDIALEPDKAVQKVQEKFCLDLTDEEAIQYIQSLLNESIGAVFPQVMERIHQVAQLLRS
ncbi:Phosphatidylinositol (PI) 3-kinase [Chytridiales sp. JEL 0842]|nr:Phosphatidylinositol (PI) 3-kinase [Chytridiales sp. JEL 0842]